MITVDAAERRRRLAVRHGLAPEARFATVPDAVDAMVVSHATDPLTVFHGPALRLRDGHVDDVVAALYDDRSIVRMIGMRRTLWLATRAAVPVVQAAGGAAIGARERRRIARIVADLKIVSDAEAWLDDVAEATVAALEARGSATGAELSADVPQLRTSRLLGAGKTYETTAALTSNVLVMLGAQGRIVRGRPAGTITSTRYVWTTYERWLGQPLTALEPAGARAELAGRWLQTFGPARVEDLQWWTGWTKTDTRAALSGLDLVEVDLAPGPGIALADDLDPTPDPGPWAALLPALDPTPMGWQERDWFLGPHREQLFDRNGNVGPTLWLDGRIVGGWARRAEGEIVVHLLEDVGRDARALIDVEIDRTAGLLPDKTRAPSFATPLERRLRL